MPQQAPKLYSLDVGTGDDLWTVRKSITHAMDVTVGHYKVNTDACQSRIA
jgi:hypothetical protein